MAIDRAKLTKSAQKHLAKGNLDKAIVDYEKLVAGDPNDSRSLLKLGDLYTKKGAVHAACETYAKVANQYADQGFFLKAVAVYKQVLKLDPSKLEIWERLAEMYELLTLTSDALSTYERVAEGYTQSGKSYKALHALSKLAELAPDNFATQIRYAEALSKARRVDEAVGAFERAAVLLKNQGRVLDYIKVTERLLYHQPENATRARELARVYLDQRDPRLALSKLQPCFKADPKDVATLGLLAEAFAELGQQDKTLSVYREMSRLHAAAGRTAEQVKVLRAILQIVPSDPEARTALEELENTASEHLSLPVIELEDEDDDDLIMLEDDDSGVVSLADSGTRSLPENELEEDTDTQVERLMTECEVFVKYGLQDKIEAQLKAVLTLAPNHLEARLKLAEHYMQGGYGAMAAEQLLASAELVRVQDLDLAIEYCTLAVQHDPDNLQAKERLQSLAHDRPSDVYPDAHVDPNAISGEREAIPAIEDEDDADDDEIIILGDDDDISELPLEDVRHQQPPVHQPPLLSASHSPVVPPRTGAAVVPSLQATMGGTPPPPSATTSVEFSVRQAENERPTSRPPASPRHERRSAQSRPLDLPPPLTSFGTQHGGGFARAKPPSAPNFRPVTPADEVRYGRRPSSIPARFEERADATQRMDLTEHRRSSIPAPPKPAGLVGAPTEIPRYTAPFAASPPPDLAAELPADLPADLAEAVEEIDFYLSQGMADEAEETLQDAYRNFPNHPVLLAKQVEVERLAGEDGDSGVEEVVVSYGLPPLTPPTPPPPPKAESAFDEEDLSFALAQKLAAESPAEPRTEDANDVDVGDVINQFRAGVRAAVDPSDAATHYDLGIAYMEMGLHAEAIEEFRLCLDDTARRCQAHTMIGLSYVSKGEMEHAVSHFKDALTYEPSVQEKLDLWFEIGNAYELLGKGPDALEYYRKVEQVDPGYRDIAERVQRLESPTSEKQEEDEFDAMFDNLILKE